eukprot:3197664-Amphidinium_carterae.1
MVESASTRTLSGILGARRFPDVKTCATEVPTSAFPAPPYDVPDPPERPQSPKQLGVTQNWVQNGFSKNFKSGSKDCTAGAQNTCLHFGDHGAKGLQQQ